MLGVVENMSDIRIPFSSVGEAGSGVRLRNKLGIDVTASMMAKIRETCPELLDIFIESDLFKVPSAPVKSSSGPPLTHNNGDNNHPHHNGSSSSPDESQTMNTPRSMAKAFDVPYLGCIPMDPNLMKACEEGKSFLEVYPVSTAARQFSEIVQKVLDATTNL